MTEGAGLREKEADDGSESNPIYCRDDSDGLMAVIGFRFRPPATQ